MAEGKGARVWFITGASTGFGRLLAEEVLRRGERVIATARDLSKVDDLQAQYPETARAMPLDVTRPEQVALIADQAIAAFGQVDVLVNNEPLSRQAEELGWRADEVGECDGSS